ncbi:RING finger protein 223 [Syngnathoides biaculeatus]|uniref:RING finger protein 223 n=1 Tax=Syngnathoides biaculeatus TaxID=300417 RepID=UPI002ADDB083|nr:RING finger protein 223 [Syngnathoides biaculeatus]
MEQSLQFWHTQVEPQAATDEPQKKMSMVSQLECPICYNTYDNVFKTPKLLACSHTFCLECLSRLMAISAPEQDGVNQGVPPLLCPFCRHSTALPEGGPPSLPTNHEMLHKLPGHQQQEEPVWLDGEKLCYKTSRPASDSISALCICIDIGADKGNGSPIQTPPQRSGLLDRLADWKRMMLFVVLMVLLVVVVLWPLQCVFSTGNMRCMQMGQPNRTATTTVAAFNPLNRPAGLSK